MSFSSRALAVLLACIVQTPVFAVRRVIVQTHGLDAQSLSAVENSTALLEVNQISKPSGSKVQKALVKVLKTALGHLPLIGEELGEPGCATTKNCPFLGTVTVELDKSPGVEVGCGEHLTVQSTNVIHATAISLPLSVFLDQLVIPTAVGGITLDGTVTAVAEIPSLTFTVDKGVPDVDQEEAQAWSLTLKSFTNRQGEGRGSNVGAALQATLGWGPGVQEKLGNFVMGLLRDTIIEAIQTNANTFTDNKAVRAALGVARVGGKANNIFKSRGRRVYTDAEC